MAISTNIQVPPTWDVKTQLAYDRANLTHDQVMRIKADFERMEYEKRRADYRSEMVNDTSLEVLSNPRVPKAVLPVKSSLLLLCEDI